MKPLPYRLVRCTAVVLLLAWAAAARSDTSTDYNDFSELDLESLLDQTIVTASRQAQKLRDTPVTATVITREQIADSGARSIPELLRDIPGVDVIQTTSSSYDVSARGLNQPGSNAMLVLVDGRSIYMDSYGLTVWDMLSIGLEDIQSVEVIKGPASVLYGANAFAGVINVITIPAGERAGLTARVHASNVGESYGSLRHSGRADAWSWRASSSWDRGENWETDTRDSDIVRFDGRIHRDLGEGSSLSAGGGHVNGSTRVLVSDEPLWIDGVMSHGRIDAHLGQVLARVSTQVTDVEVAPQFLPAPRATIEAVRRDLEVQHAFTLGSTHDLLWGGSYRHIGTRYGAQQIEAKEDIYAGFVLEEWTPRPELRISAGFRYEHHPRVGSQVAPRGGVVYEFAADQTLHASYGKAYRDPTYVESYLYLEADSPLDVPVIIRGEPDNDSETIEAFEIGYRGLLSRAVYLQGALFHHTIDDIIEPSDLDTFPSPPAPVGGIASEIAFVNGPSWRARGGELSVQADPTAWLQLTGSYSYVWLDDVATGHHVSRAPVHAAKLGGVLRPAATHELLLDARFRSAAVWETENSPRSLSDERFVIDATWNVEPVAGDLTLSIVLRNLLDRRFRDHPLAIEQRRRLLMSITVDF